MELTRIGFQKIKRYYKMIDLIIIKFNEDKISKKLI